MPDLLVLVAGSGPLAAELKARAAGLEDHLQFLGFLPDEHLPVAYRAADLSVVPSVALEGFGLIVAESLAAGTPALVTAVGGLPETLEGLAPQCVMPETGPGPLGLRYRGRALRAGVAAVAGGLRAPRAATLRLVGRRRSRARGIQGGAAMRARVLFLDHAGVLGGAELAILDVARAFRATSTVVLFADGPFRTVLANEGIHVRVIEGSASLHAVRRETRWPSPGAVLGLLSLVRRLVPLARRHDCLHANSQKAFVTACLVGLVARRPVVWDLNDLLTPEHFSRANIRLDVALANTVATRLIANSQATADAFIANGGQTDKLSVVHNGISSAAFDAVTDDDVAEARRELGLGQGPVVGIFSRLGEWKGQHVALDALVDLPGVQLLLVGDALFGEEAYAAELPRQGGAVEGRRPCDLRRLPRRTSRG